MSTQTRQHMDHSLRRLMAQRDRYRLALHSAGEPRMRERHGRTLARLDEEILGLREALEAISWDEVARVSGVFAAVADEPLVIPRRGWGALTMVLGAAFLVGFALVSLL
jgi:hypothetical protein